MEKDEISKLIANEVAKQLAHQLTPLREKLELVYHRLKGLWGNGTGPPGYLELAREEDKRRNEELDDQHKQVLERLEELGTQITNEGGVKTGADKAESRHAQTITLWALVLGVLISFGLLVAAAMTFWATLRLKSGELTLPPHLRSQGGYTSASYAAGPPNYQLNGRIQ